MTRLTLNFIETSIKWHFKTAKGGRTSSYHLFYLLPLFLYIYCPNWQLYLGKGRPNYNIFFEIKIGYLSHFLLGRNPHLLHCATRQGKKHEKHLLHYRESNPTKTIMENSA